MRTKAAAAILVAAVALIVLALTLPAGAAAAKTYKQPASVTVEFLGRGTNGFGFLLFASEGLAFLSTSKEVGKTGETGVYYSDTFRHQRSDAADGHVDLKIGKLGHFRGRFIATSTKTQKPSRFCDGKPTVTEKGYFLGSFKFHGERGYTAIDARRVSGYLTHIGAQTCKLPAESEGHRSPREEKAEEDREEGEFRLLAADSKARTVFQASREEGPPELHFTPTTYDASVEGGKVGAFRVTYYASIVDLDGNAAETFQVPDLAEPLHEATIAPRAPFSGAATFHLETPKTASWTGDLAVELPGLGTVPLTAPTIAAGLCQGRSDCTKTLPRLPQLLLEATGSASDGSGFGIVSVAVPSKHGS